jgi:alpha-glucosidase
LAVRRAAEGRSVLCVFNMASHTAAWPAGVPGTGETLASANGAAPGQLPPFAAILIEERA